MKLKDIFFKTDKKAEEKRIISRVIKRQENITRKDIADWKAARMEATRTTEPKQRLLQLLYDEIMLDAKMTSQIGLRIDKSQVAVFTLKRNDKNDEDATKLLMDTGLYDALSEAIVHADFYGQSVCEFSFDKNGKPKVEVVPRKHISPETGMFYPDFLSGEKESYRDRSDFGSFIIEFYPQNGDLGLLNKAVPYVLMKKFALSCWSELCEIFGIPPRVLKTNTTDEGMLNRAEMMMCKIGSAAYFIIDTEEDFQFAQATNTNGDVYKNFIATCDEQISLLNVGAVLGQDTINGNRSKEEASSLLLDAIVEADKRKIQFRFNNTIIPALESIGVLPGGLRFEFTKAVNTEKLWNMVFQASTYYDFDIDWLNETFGMEITGARMQQTSVDDNTHRYNFFA